MSDKVDPEDEEEEIEEEETEEEEIEEPDDGTDDEGYLDNVMAIFKHYLPELDIDALIADDNNWNRADKFIGSLPEESTKTKGRNSKRSTRVPRGGRSVIDPDKFTTKDLQNLDKIVADLKKGQKT